MLYLITNASYKEKMNISIADNISLEDLKKVLQFIKEKSDRISVTRYYHGGMSRLTFDSMQAEYKKYIMENDWDRRERYKNNIEGYKDNIHKLFSAKLDINEYFDDLLEQDLEEYEIDYDACFKEKEICSFETDYDDFLKNIFTRISPSSEGGVYEVCYFNIGEVYNEIEKQIKNMYDFPYYISQVEFEDLTFYKNENVRFTICSHEKNNVLSLEEEEYQMFLKLNIKHKVHE